MNGSMVRALLQDALQQVLDNRIFRLLLLVVLGFVAPTFLVAFREHDVQVLWGWQQIDYEQLFKYIDPSQRGHGIQDVQGRAIQVYQNLVVNGLCGNLGMVLCVAATAFFVPRMLERGSADVLFSKPLSRMTLLLARYVSGILFVAILASALVFGIYLGFLIVSGYGDPGFLWGALTLVYLFAIVHGVTTLAGVLTRSTVASTLIALVFFMGTGCIHQGWRIRQWAQDTELTRKLRHQVEVDQDADAPVDPVSEEEPGTFWKVIFATIDTLHYTLPKTSDADLITKRLRKALERAGTTIVDETVHLSIPEPPEGFRLVGGDLPAPAKGKLPIDLAAKTIAWRLEGSGGVETARIEISRRSRVVERPSNGENGARARPRRLTAASAAAEWTSRAKADGTLASETSERKFSVDGIPAVVVGWYDEPPAGRRSRQVAALSVGDWIVEVSETADPAWSTPDERTTHLDRFLEGFEIARDPEFEDPSAWYERRFSATAPLPYNALFSIGTSIAFTVLVLACASWKLSRIDF